MSCGNEVKSHLKIIIPGPLTTVQDGGRIGHMAEGFPVCGAADTDAMEAGNLLCGNVPDTAVIEITLGGFGAMACGSCAFAVTGADAELMINGVPAPRYRTHFLHDGDYIYIGFARSGCRVYLAVSGGIDVPAVMGSKSTFLKTSMGGFNGRKLESGDLLPLGAAVITRDTENRSAEIPVYEKNVTLRAMAGPQDNMFPAEEIEKFFSSEYKVTPASDRMGLRLDGPPLSAIDGTDIISDGIAVGSVQIPRNGMPIILGADRQTTGGYAKPATVISADIPKTGQLVPGCTVRFKRVSSEEAAAAAAEHRKYIIYLAKRMGVKLK